MLTILLRMQMFRLGLQCSGLLVASCLWVKLHVGGMLGQQTSDASNCKDCWELYLGSLEVLLAHSILTGNAFLHYSGLKFGDC